MANLQQQSEELIDIIGDAAVNATPRLTLALVFLVGAAIAVQVLVRRASGQLTAVTGNAAEERFLEFLVRGLLWFGVCLIALSLLGFQQLATALGTASGFLALAVADGLREALSVAIGGLYLINDEQFVEGRRVSTADETGRIEHIGLRRTKLRDDEDGELTVISNNRIEPKWTLHEDGETTVR